jgi:hypothetical protein
MNIAIVSTTFWTGLHEHMARCFNRYTDHETRVLSCGYWDTRKRFNPEYTQEGCVYSVMDPDTRNEILEWADVIQLAYTCSLATLGRPDLLGKKVVSWYLGTRWKSELFHLFPSDHAKKIHFIWGCEGWERYPNIAPYEWTSVPVLFPIEDEYWMPIPWKKRKRMVSMAPRALGDYSQTGGLISAPRSPHLINALMKSSKIPFDRLHNRKFPYCMRRKAMAWIGIDDIVNPLVHKSGLEYLAVGTPCINRWDAFVERKFKDLLGCPKPPFVDATLPTLVKTAKRALKAKESLWKRRCTSSREWMEKYYHPREMVQRYLDVYARG